MITQLVNVYLLSFYLSIFRLFLFIIVSHRRWCQDNRAQSWKVKYISSNLTLSLLLRKGRQIYQCVIKNAIKYNFLFFNCEKKSKPTFANMNFAKRRSWFRGSGTINYQCARQNDNDKTMEAECCFSTRVITRIGQLILLQEEEMKA